MGIEVIKGAGMAYQGSSSTAEMKEENVPKIENAENLTVSENLAKDTSDLNTKQTSGEANNTQQQSQQQKNAQLKKAVDFESLMMGTDIYNIIMKPLAIMEKPIIKHQVAEQGQSAII